MDAARWRRCCDGDDRIPGHGADSVFSGGLSQAEIERMVREAEQHAAEDKKRRELIEAKNQADALIYSTEKELKEYGSGGRDSDKQNIEAAIAALRAMLSGDSVAAIRQGMERLSQTTLRLVEAMQQAGSTDASATTRPGEAAKGADDVVDAEFEDVDDSKRRAS